MRNDYAHNRLTMWALWWSRGHTRGGNFASGSWETRVDGSGYDAPSVISNIDAEAEQTDKAVASLDATTQTTVHVYYVEGGKAEKKAARLGVSLATLYQRIDTATHAVARWLDDQQRAADAERARVEALQRSVVADDDEQLRRARAVDAKRAWVFGQEPVVPVAVRDRTGSTLAAHLAATRKARGFPT